MVILKKLKILFGEGTIKCFFLKFKNFFQRGHKKIEYFSEFYNNIKYYLTIYNIF